jgi:hypothetical protein
MAKIAKRTIGIAIALVFAITVTLLSLVAIIYLVAYMNNMR